MATVNISDLTSDYLFEARLRYDTDLTAQFAWLRDLYLESAADRSGEEVTSLSFVGSSHSAQFRASTPEDRRAALRAAIESVEALQAGATASQFSKPFGFRFDGAPAAVLG